MNAYQRIPPFVEIMDSTLRDGEQTNGVSFLPHEKLVMARKLLNGVNVDRIEVASARVSEGEREAVTMICRYAAQIGRLAQTIDYSNSQVEFLKFAYHSCLDPRNYSRAIEVLTFTSDRKKVTDYIATQQ